MSQPKALVLRAPGTNCNVETEFAFQRAGAATELLHVNRLLENPNLFSKFQILCIPGGFSYGDDVAAGRILGNQIQHHLADQIAQFKDAGKLILGICNGFQVLLKSGALLDSTTNDQPAATLTRNASGKFEDRWVRLASLGSKCIFLKNIESMYLPIAHAEGKFVTLNNAVFKSLDSNQQLAIRYRPLKEGDDACTVTYPDNPNGSAGNVAGVCDPTGRVFGLMPHPERHLDPTQHPRWTRGEAGETGDGLQVFVNAVEYFS